LRSGLAQLCNRQWCQPGIDAYPQRPVPRNAADMSSLLTANARLLAQAQPANRHSGAGEPAADATLQR
jgi:hypothetical protein